MTFIKHNPNIDPQIAKMNDCRKVTVSSLAGAALGIAGGVAGVYALAKKGNPAVTLKNLKYAEKDVLLLATGSVLGGLTGGLIADKNKENVKPKLREASQQLIANTAIPITTLAIANKVLDKTGFKMPQIKSNSKPAKIANVVLAALPRVATTILSLGGGMMVGNKIVNKANNLIFKEDVKHCVKSEDMLVHADDICMASSMIFKNAKGLSNIVSKVLPLTFIVSGAKTGMQQKEC